MRNFFAVLILLCFSSISFAQSTGDNFQFNPVIKAQQQVPATPSATVANGTPIVVTAPPAGGLSDILTAVNAALLALIAGVLGFKKTPAAPGIPTSDVNTVVASIAAKMSGGIGPIITDPSVRSAVDSALLQLERSGLPTAAITGAAGFVPGASPIVSFLEPMIRNAVDQALAAKLGTAVAPTASVSLPASVIGDLTAVLGRLIPKAT